MPALDGGIAKREQVQPLMFNQLTDQQMFGRHAFDRRLRRLIALLPRLAGEIALGKSRDEAAEHRNCQPCAIVIRLVVDERDRHRASDANQACERAKLGNAPSAAWGREGERCGEQIAEREHPGEEG